MNFEGTSNQDADNRYNASPQLCIKSIKTEDPNQIPEIKKKEIEEELQKEQQSLNEQYCRNQQCNYQDFSNNPYFAQENHQQVEYPIKEDQNSSNLFESENIDYDECQLQQYNLNIEEIHPLQSQQNVIKEQKKKKKKKQKKQTKEQKIKYIKEFKRDQSLIIKDELQKIQDLKNLDQNLDELLNKCYAIQEQNKKVFEDETKKVDFYKRKLKKVSEKKFIKKFEIIRFKSNKYNFICQHLLKQHFLKEKEQNEQLKYEGKSYPIIFSCFIQYTLNWFNLLDFKQNDNKKILDSIKEVIKQCYIETLITKETFEYFDKNPYKKYDFIEFMIKLIIVFKQIQGIARLEIQQNELLIEMKNISKIKKDRYFQKKNINFSRQTLIKLIKSDAKPELDIAIQTFLDNPNKILSQMKLNENECNLVRKEMEKIQIKLLK